MAIMQLMQLMQLKYLTHLKQRWKSRVITQTTIALLGGLGGLAGLEILTAPAVQAYEARLSVTLDREKDETFQTLVKRAEVVARAAVQRAFDTDILATDVAVFINGRSGGLEAPLLSIQISRFQWQSFPDARRWATYYPSTQSLLRLDPLPTQAPLVPGSTLAPENGVPLQNPTAIPVPNGTTPTGVTPQGNGTSGNNTSGNNTSGNNDTQLVVPDTIRPIEVPTTMPTTVPDELLLENS